MAQLEHEKTTPNFADIAELDEISSAIQENLGYYPKEKWIRE